jgi:hypothetical protein
MTKPDRRIPVTEERRRELNDLKDAGQTYDELLQRLVRSYSREHLAERARELREADGDELTPLGEV